MRALLPPPLMAVPRIAAWDAIVRNYLGSDTDLGVGNSLTGEALYYYATILNIDTCPAAILPLLATMFGVDGFKGFDYATTEDQQRQTIKNAILMKRRHSTNWSLITALENAGYQNVVINDHLPCYFWDGSWQFDGSRQFNSNQWAQFTISLQPPVGVLPQNVDIVALMQLVNYWKRACTQCLSITIDQLVIVNFGLGNQHLLFDGTWTWNGVEPLNGIGV